MLGIAKMQALSLSNTTTAVCARWAIEAASLLGDALQSTVLGQHALPSTLRECDGCHHLQRWALAVQATADLPCPGRACTT